VKSQRKYSKYHVCVCGGPEVEVRNRQRYMQVSSEGREDCCEVRRSGSHIEPSTLIKR
jgi:hypothetical protein